jgi:CheY-like chemotaxis protein
MARLHVLLAEDNLPDALIVREAIRQHDLPFELHTVVDGQEAIEFLKRTETDPSAPCPELVLLDLNLPRQDGFAVLRYLRASQRCKEIPVLIITSSDSPGDLKQVTEFGARYFRKPPSYTEFLKLGDILKQMFEERRAD